MTGKQKIQAAFTKEGTREIPAVICYEGIYIRDHWSQLTSCPWWYAEETELDKQIQWRGEVFPKIGQDWYALPSCPTKEERANIMIQERTEGIFRVDRRNKNEERLHAPKIGGDSYQAWDNPQSPATPEDIDQLFPYSPLNPEDIEKNGRKDLAARLNTGLCAALCPLRHVVSPLQSCASIWGFSGFMIMLKDDPGLVKYACERLTAIQERKILEAKALGTEVIWIEECYVDMISPDMYKEFNTPYITRVTESIRSAGMKSVYYHCGDPAHKLDQILDVGADAVSFEESKKGFIIDIEDIVDAVQGRCTVLGNLDATGFLPVCTYDELKSSISRFIAAGRKNKNRFIVSMGSPVTPETPVEKVRLYCELVHELGS